MNDETTLFAESFDHAATDEATELRALERALSLAQGFTLLLATCNLPEERRRLMAMLQKRLPSLTVRTVELGGPVRHLLDELSAQIGTTPPDTVFVAGFENSLSHRDNPRDVPLIANLNAARNSFPAVVPCPLVLWVPQYILQAIVQGAPDFFSIRSGTYYFAATPHSTKALSQSLTSGAESAAHSLPIAEKQERIAAIRSLLADYQSLPANQRDHRAELRLLTRLGNMLNGIGQAREAVAVHHDCLNLAREIESRFWEGNALGNLGNAYYSLGEVRHAIEYHEQALEVSRQIGDRHGEGSDLGNLGNAYADLGEVRRAVEYHEQQLEIAREIGDRHGEGNALMNLGNAYYSLGEVRRAIEYYEQALVIDREIGDRRGEGNDLMNLGNAYADLGEGRRAIEYYEQALLISREIGDRRGEGAALGNLGLAYADLGEVRRAIEYYEQQLEIAREIGDQRGEGNGSWNMSLALDSLGERAQAVELATAALEIYEQIEDPFAAQVREWLEKWRVEVADGGDEVL